MKFKFKKLAVPLLLVASAVSATSCNGKKVDPDTIVIRAVNLGYGLDWLYDLTAKYSEK